MLLLPLRAPCRRPERPCIRLWATLPAGLGQTAGLWNSAPSAVLPTGPSPSPQGGPGSQKVGVVAAVRERRAGRDGRGCELAPGPRGRGGLPAALPQRRAPRAMRERWGRAAAWRAATARTPEVPLWGGSWRSAAVASLAEVSGCRYCAFFLGRDRASWVWGGGVGGSRPWSGENAGGEGSMAKGGFAPNCVHCTFCGTKRFACSPLSRSFWLGCGAEVWELSYLPATLVAGLQPAEGLGRGCEGEGEATRSSARPCSGRVTLSCSHLHMDLSRGVNRWLLAIGMSDTCLYTRKYFCQVTTFFGD